MTAPMGNRLESGCGMSLSAGGLQSEQVLVDLVRLRPRAVCLGWRLLLSELAWQTFGQANNQR